MMSKLEPKMNLILLVSLTVTTTRCNDRDMYDFSSTNYKKVEIYCMCFLHDPIEESKNRNYPASTCNTSIAVRPSSLVIPRRFFDSTTEAKTIDALKRIIFQGNSKSEKGQELYPDSRFLILFKKNDSEADTIVYSYPNELYLNNKRILRYSFNVVDSIRQVFGKETIKCANY